MQTVLFWIVAQYKVKRLPVGLLWKQVVARRDQCGLSADVLLFVDAVSRSCQESIPQRVRGEEVSSQTTSFLVCGDLVV